MITLLTKTKALATLFLFALLFLPSCAPAYPPTPGPTITDIDTKPEFLMEGSPIFYTITYENTHATDTFYDVTISAKFLDFFDLITTSPPAQISQKDGEMYVTWNVGTLKPAEIGALVVKFNTDSQIPPEIYQIEIFGDIRGNNLSNTPVVNYGKVTQYIEGRFTPTGAPSKPSTPDSMSILLTNTLTSQLYDTPSPTFTVMPSDTPTWTSTPTPVIATKNPEILVAVIGLIGVIVGGIITAYASVQAAKIQAKKNEK